MTRMPCRQCAGQSPSRRSTPWRGRAAKRWRRGRLELEISARASRGWSSVTISRKRSRRTSARLGRCCSIWVRVQCGWGSEGRRIYFRRVRYGSNSQSAALADFSKSLFLLVDQPGRNWALGFEHRRARQLTQFLAAISSASMKMSAFCIEGCSPAPWRSRFGGEASSGEVSCIRSGLCLRWGARRTCRVDGRSHGRRLCLRHSRHRDGTCLRA
jgi:hypothetical protein